MSDQKKVRILFAYNDRAVEILVKKWWLDEYEVDFAYHGLAAMNFIEQNQYHIIIVTYHLSVLSGLDIADYILGSQIPTPILMLDNVCDNNALNQIKDRNLPYLKVPFEPQNLKQKIKELLN